MRKPIIAGNWKMNKTPSEARELVSALIPLVKDAKCDVVVCTPAVDFAAVSEVIKGTNIKLGAENMHWKESGAYTGELSAAMLKESGVEYVILGHSERRQYFGETDATVNQRVLAAVKAGLTPIICVGEKKEEREAGYTNALVSYQTQIALSGLTADEVKNVVIAYEPVWAIGTGLTATDEQANETIGVIREAVRAAYGDAADDVRIQYGGSMNPRNCKGLMAQPEIDGGLIGGASLKAEDFSKVVRFDAERSKYGKETCSALHHGRLRLGAGADVRQCDCGGQEAEPRPSVRKLSLYHDSGLRHGGRPAGRADGQQRGRPHQHGRGPHRLSGADPHRQGNQ